MRKRSWRCDVAQHFKGIHITNDGLAGFFAMGISATNAIHSTEKKGSENQPMKLFLQGELIGSIANQLII